MKQYVKDFRQLSNSKEGTSLHGTLQQNAII